jgi:hypothetical protein
MEVINHERRIELYINSLVNQREFFSNWIQKKEISIWSATLLYVGIYWTVFAFLFEKKSLAGHKIIIIIFSSMILLLFVAFIYSQFCAMIYAAAARLTITNGIARILANPQNFGSLDLELRSDNETIIPKFLENELEIQKGNVDSFKDRNRPFQVLWHVFLGLLTFFLSKYWRTNLRKNRERQEGIIYLLMITIWFTFTIWILGII